MRHGCTGVLTCAKNGGMYLGDEIEGLLIEPIRSGPYRGDLHVLMIDNDVDRGPSPPRARHRADAVGRQ